MPRLLHILPHRGGGGEVVVDMLGELAGYRQRRVHLATARTPARAAPSIATGLARVAAEARAADLVHVVGDTATLLCQPLLSSYRWVWGTHGLHLLRRLEGPVGQIAAWRARASVAAARATVCSSRLERDELAEMVGAPLAGKLVDVQNGIPLPARVTAADRLAARERLAIPSEGLVALYLGELEQRKRPLVAVAAAERAAARGTDLTLLVAGSGPLAPEVESSAGRVVRALGQRDDPSTLLTAADVFLLPSEREGLSLALLEALGHGVAVVVSDGPGNAEAVGEAGIVHPLDDVEMLADVLVRLGADPDERARLGEAARGRAERRFTVDRFLGDMERVFSDALRAG